MLEININDAKAITLEDNGETTVYDEEIANNIALDINGDNIKFNKEFTNENKK